MDRQHGNKKGDEAMKVYELSDGRKATARELSNESGLPVGTVYTRLRKTRNVDLLTRSVEEARRDTGWHKARGRLVFRNSNEQVPYD